jgi:hypothetical protein
MRLSLSGFSALAISATLAAACVPEGSANISHESVVDLGSFGPYVAEFQARAASYGVKIEITDLIVEFGPMTNPLERGYCEMGSHRTPLIVIDQTYWNSSDEDSRKALILHELGHCVLRRAHLSALTATGVPESLMNPYTIPSNVFHYNEEHYWQELFSITNTM